MSKIDTEYFARRMREEREAAERTTSPVSEVHRALAEKYAGIIAENETDEQPS